MNSNLINSILKKIESFEEDKIQVKFPHSFERYEIKSLIVNNEFFDKYLVEDKCDSKQYTMKMYPKHKILNEKIILGIEKEHKIKKEWEYSYLNKLIYYFQDEYNLYYIENYYKFGDLSKQLEQKIIFNEEETSYIIRIYYM